MDIFGAKKAAVWLSKNFYKVQSGAKITDIGCGPGSLLRSYYKHLFPSDINYHGIDPLKIIFYLPKREFGHSVNFYHGTTENYINDLRFRNSDIIFCCGVLHHIDDNQVLSLFDFVHSNLKPNGGRFSRDGTSTFIKRNFHIKVGHESRQRNVYSKRTRMEKPTKQFVWNLVRTSLLDLLRFRTTIY